MLALWIGYLLLISLLWVLFPGFMLTVTLFSLAVIVLEARNAPLLS